MKISLDKGTNEYRITSYQAGSIKINDTEIDYPIILGANGFKSWEARDMLSLTEALLEAALQDKPDILILGTGQKQIFPGAELMRPIAHANVGLEVMDTAAACRTYNILIAEDRNVVAALFMI